MSSAPGGISLDPAEAARLRDLQGFDEPEDDEFGPEPPDEPGPEPLPVRWVSEALDDPPPEPPVLVEGFLRSGELAALGAGRAIGKSWIALQLATLLGRGEGHFLGTLPVRRPARVLIAQGELDQWGSASRWAKLTGDQGAPPGVAETFERFRIQVIRRRSLTRHEGGTDSQEWIDAILDHRLEATIAAHGFDVLILDPWAVFYSGSENSNDEVEEALSRLRDLSLRHGLATVVIHHFGKGTEARDPEDLWRGASRLADWASTRVTVLPHYTAAQAAKQGMTRADARRYLDVRFLCRSSRAPDDFSIRWDSDTGWFDLWTPGGRVASTRLNPVDLVEICAKSGGDWPSVKEAAKALDVHRDTATALLDAAARDGHLEEYPGPHGSRGFRLPRLKLGGGF